MTTAYQIFQLPKGIPLNAGTIMPGGKASFFLTGTTTSTPVYSDSGLTTPHTQPVVADSAGILPVIYLDPTIVYKVTLTTSADVLYYTIDPANDQVLSASSIGAALYPRTAAEIAAGVVPTNYYIPSHEAVGKFDLRRYGAAETYSAGTDDLQFWNTAISVINATANKSGTITGACRTYRIDGTLTISIPIGVDFGPNSNGLSTEGFVLFSDTNATILRFDDPSVSRFVSWSNFTVCGTSVNAGTGSAKTSQHGIVVNNRGVYLTNVSIRACGGNGIYGWDSVGSHFKNIYISLCDGDGTRVDQTQSANAGKDWGFNVWTNVSCTANSGNGRYIVTASGRDGFYNCDCEQNTLLGRRFGANSIGNVEVNGHSELNTGGSVQFDATSNYNLIDIIWGDSAGTDLDPVNNGGTDNRILGQKFASGGGGFNTPRIFPRLMAQSYVEYTTLTTPAPNAIPYDNTKPQASGEGATVMSLTHTPQQAGNILKVKANVNFSFSAGGVGIMALFNDRVSATDAVAARAEASAVDSQLQLYLEYNYTTTSTTSVNFNVNIGSNAAATISFNGVAGAQKFGGINCSSLSVEEYAQ